MQSLFLQIIVVESRCRLPLHGALCFVAEEHGKVSSQSLSEKSRRRVSLQSPAEVILLPFMTWQARTKKHAFVSCVLSLVHAQIVIAHLMVKMRHARGHDMWIAKKSHFRACACSCCA